MSALERLTSHSFSKKLAKLLIPHKHNDHHPYLIRHESLFAVTFLILLLQFFSFTGVSNARVLGFATDITRAAIINLTNQERANNGVPQIVENSKLNNSSQMKAQDMFAKDYWAHFAPDGTSPWHFFKLAGYSYSWAGENLARDFSTSAGVINGWMNSPSHKENMLNPNFTEIGVGVLDGILEGEETTLVVQHLGKVLGSTAGTTAGKAGSAPSVPTQQPTTVDDNLNTVAIKPTQPTASANVSEVQEKIAAAATPEFDLVNSWNGLGIGQKITLLLLFVLMSIFMFDSVLLFRKGHERKNSHSILHAGVLVILIVAIIRGASGGIL